MVLKMKHIFGLFKGRNTESSLGFWVEGGSLVYVPSDRAYEVHKLLQEHREHGAEIARLRAIARVSTMAR